MKRKVERAISGVARLFYSGAIFSNFECSWGRKVIPNMKHICRGGRGVQNYFENVSAYLCKSPEVPIMFFKNVIFWLKKSNFLKKCRVGNQILKAQGPPKKSGGPHAARGPHFGHVCAISSTYVF